MGCFYDNRKQRAFPNLVRNLRPEIDWYHLEKTVQKCTLLSKQRNYQVRQGRFQFTMSLILNIEFAGEILVTNQSQMIANAGRQ